MTTGEMAQIMGITKHTLFHYDEIGLFCPEQVTENGYRFYSVEQIDLLDTILLMRDLGMPLKEIRDYMNHRSPEAFLEVFAQREEQIDAQIRKLREMKTWIRHRTEKMRELKDTDFSEITVKSCQRRYYLCSEVRSDSEKVFAGKINELIEQLQRAGTRMDYDITYIQHQKNIDRGLYTVYDNVAVLTRQKPPLKNYRVLPAGEYLTAYHVGHWTQIGEAYDRLTRFKEQTGMETEADYFEHYIIDNFISDNYQDYVTEISVRMKHSEQMQQDEYRVVG